MAVFIINYDFKGDDTKRQAVRDLPGAEEIAESAYAVERDKTASEVRDEAYAAIRVAVKQATGNDLGAKPLSSGDRFWIVPVTRAIVGSGPKLIVKWFTDRGV
jgi:hypothetical protein